MINSVDLGKNIARLRHEENMRQKELAKNAGISLSYLRRIEEGNCSMPRAKTLSRIAVALNVSVDKLVK